jgi:membrane protein implicated in regulation of membrane protease activity
MEILLNSALVWFAIGFAFFLLEFLLPGFILFFFGIGAWVVALLSLFLDISLNTQIVIFIISSLITVVLFRNWVKRKFGLTGVNAQQLEDEFIGKSAKAETSIKPGENGKVQFKGTSWDAASDAIISAGDNVLIIETRSILLIVTPIKSL